MAMAFGFYFGVTFLLTMWSTITCADIPEGALRMECHDRYFMIAVDFSSNLVVHRFEAVDGTDVYAITKEYGAKCGYTVSAFSPLGRTELRASYFSCHTNNKDDEVFTFKFNLVTMTDEGKEVTYALNKTCSPSLPWSPREVTCEVNYMEVSIKSEISCPSGTGKQDDWNALKQAHGSTTSDWQVMFQIHEEQLPAMNLSEARKLGYVFDLTDGRLVFRTPYGQPESCIIEVNGVPVEVVHATLFSRQSWFVHMVDLEAACSMHQGLYDDIYMMCQTPDVLYQSLEDPKLSMGFNGELVELPVAEERGFIVEKHNGTVQIGIPHNADGVYRKSIEADHHLFEYYAFHLYVEQILVDEDLMETRLRLHKHLITPLLPRPVFTENRTVPEERMFTVYLGDVPEDVELTVVHLNGQEFTVPFTNTSSHSITKIVHPNNTHGYTLKVPYDDPVVMQQFSKEDAAMQHSLNINFTLTVLPENEHFYEHTSVMALTDASPPVFDVICSESGITFKLDHRPFDYLWEICINSDVLTSELAAQHGYIMSNDSQSLLLEVPLFSHGYEYKDVTLKGFFGTFEINMRDHETSEIQSSTTKTCPFSTTEFIMCTDDGKMIAVANLSLAIPSGGVPARTNLMDKYCGPKETDSTRALFSFPLNSCGSKVKLHKENVTYQNEIFYSRKQHSVSTVVSDDATERVLIQCTYPLAGLHRLFSVYRFESDTEGVGSIIHTTDPAAGLQSPPIKPTTALITTPAARRPTKRPVYRPAHHPPARYFKVSGFQNLASGFRKGAQGFTQTKVNVAQI